MIGRVTSFLPLRWLAILLLSLLSATMGSAVALAERSDFDRCAVAAKTTAPIKNLTEQAADFVPLNGGLNRVTLRSPSQQMEIDLAGKSHGGVPTPHTKVSPLNPQAPNQPAYNTRNSPVEPATQQDIRTVRRYLERQN
jgi:hypothetical protein